MAYLIGRSAPSEAPLSADLGREISSYVTQRGLFERAVEVAVQSVVERFGGSAAFPYVKESERAGAREIWVQCADSVLSVVMRGVARGWETAEADLARRHLNSQLTGGRPESELPPIDEQIQMNRHFVGSVTWFP